MISRTSTLLFCAGLGCIPVAHAEPLTDQVKSCAAEAEATARLDCYDQVAARLNKVAAPSSIPVPDATGADTNTAVDAAAPPSAGEASGGPAAPSTAAGGANTATGAAATQQPADKTDSRASKGIGAVVSGVTRRPRGGLVITLDNGQVWLQLEAAEHDPLKAGDVVRISRTRQGAHVLSTPSAHGLRIKRLL